MSVPVVLPPEAEEQVRGIDFWWRGSRPLAPGLFTEELAAAFELLGAAPFAGRRYPHPEVQDVRRVLLRSTRYHVYYRVQEDAVIVLAVWSAVRGTGPKLSGADSAQE